MQAKLKNQSLFREIEDRYHTELKRLKRKKFLLKARVMLTVVLPLFIILLGVKTAKTFIRIKVRDLSAKPEEGMPEERKKQEPAASPVPVPVSFEAVEKEVIQPVPADHHS